MLQLLHSSKQASGFKISVHQVVLDAYVIVHPLLSFIVELLLLIFLNDIVHIFLLHSISQAFE